MRGSRRIAGCLVSSRSSLEHRSKPETPDSPGDTGRKPNHKYKQYKTTEQVQFRLMVWTTRMIGRVGWGGGRYKILSDMSDKRI